MGSLKTKIESKTIINWLKSKYGIVTVAFVVWMLFIDQNDVFTRRTLGNTITALELRIAENEALLEKAKLDKKALEQNVEKFAREKYYMHKDDEDVLIIEKVK